MTNIKMKSKKPIFSDMTVLGMMELDKKTLKKILDNMPIVLAAARKNKITIIPSDSDRDLELNELEEINPVTKGKKLQPDIMFG